MSVTKYFKFITNQLLNMRLNNYVLMAIAFVLQVWIFFSQPITTISVITFIGTFLGVTCVIAINAAKSVNGILGILSGICFIIIGFHAKNYLSIGEQLAYMATLDIPVLISADWNKDMASKIRKFTPKDWAVALGFTALVTIVSAIVIEALTGEPRPWADAISFALALTGGLCCYLRYNNQYFWWTAGGIFQVALWFLTWRQGNSTPAMLINYSTYLANDVLAFTLSPWFNRKARAETIANDKKLDKANQ